MSPFTVRILLAIGSVFVLSGLGSDTAHAQSGIRSMHAVSTGGSTSPLGSPTNALYANPSHLTSGSSSSFLELRLFDTRTYVGGDLFQFQHYNETLASGRSLSRSQVEESLDSWFGSRRRSGAMYVEMVPVSFSYRPTGEKWAVGGGLRFRALAKAGLNRGLFDLLLRGTGTERTVPVRGRYRAAQTVDLTGAFSYALDSMPLSIGVAPRLIFGTSFADGVLDSDVVVGEESLVHQFEYTARAAGPLSTEIYDVFDAFQSNPLHDLSSSWGGGGVVGVGAGIDLGATYEVKPDLLLGLSVTDLGMIRWQGDAQTVTPSENEFRFEGAELNLQHLRTEFDGKVGDYLRHQVDSLAREAYRDVERDRSPFVTGLPTAMQLTGTWDRGDFTVTGGTGMGFNSAAGAVSLIPSLYGGGEYQLGIVPLRAGVRLMGTQAATFAGGVGIDLGLYRFDLGVSVTPKTSLLGSGAHYAVGISLATLRF